MREIKQCEVVMLPTTDPSPIFINEYINETHLESKLQCRPDDASKDHQSLFDRGLNPQHLYVVCAEESIDIYDYVLDSTNQVRMVGGKNEEGRLYLTGIDWLSILPSSCKKIIATTEDLTNLQSEDGLYPKGEHTKIPTLELDFIKDFCEHEGYLFVNVEYIKPVSDCKHCDGKGAKEIGYMAWVQCQACRDVDYNKIPKISDNNTISVTPIQEKWDREGVINLLKEYREYAWKNGLTIRDLDMFILLKLEFKI
jgi:hypothetical protein